MTEKHQKASRAFFGNDTFGRGVELAQSVSGMWFVRFCVSGRFGRWVPYYAEVTHPTETTNVYTGEVIHFTPEESATMVNWGFGKLNKYDASALRLPIVVDV